MSEEIIAGFENDIAEKEAEIEALEQELIEYPEFSDDLEYQIQQRKLELDDLRDELYEAERRDFEAEKREEQREWENSRL